MDGNQKLVGEDSFLDVIANLVGVLIILVAVVSAQAGYVISHAQPVVEEQASLQEAQQLAWEVEHEATKLQLNCEETQGFLNQQAQELTLLEQQRHEALVQIGIVERQIDQRKAELDSERQAWLDERKQERTLVAHIESLKSQLARVDVAPEVIHKELVHYPTPIAKTVFSNEVHFRLSAGKLSFVPIDGLLQKVKSQCQGQLEKLSKATEFADSVGPDEGYVMDYRVATQSVRQGDQIGVTVEFQGFVIRPTLSDLGEPIDVALREGSGFRSRLLRFTPDKTTVSIWVYPDSFPEFVQVRDWLRSQGFQIASWPLENGALISGGPNGLRTSAQ